MGARIQLDMKDAEITTEDDGTVHYKFTKFEIPEFSIDYIDIYAGDIMLMSTDESKGAEAEMLRRVAEEWDISKEDLEAELKLLDGMGPSGGPGLEGLPPQRRA